MPATFAADSLRSSLRPLAAAQPLSEEARAYQRFYGLDLPQRKSPVVSRLGRFSSGTFELASQLWLPPDPVATLFLLHGFYDHMGLFRHVVDWALDQGFAVIACDLPGHGLSSGERASIDDFGRYQQALQDLFGEARTLGLPQPWHLFGQSTGGAIIIDHLLRHGRDSPVQGQTMLLSPLVRPRAWAGRSSVITCSSPSSKASPGVSARTPTTRRSCPSSRPTPCNRNGCRPPGSVPWPAGSRHRSRGAKPAPTADRTRRGRHDRRLGA
ncbi:alpha/beta hydrolase [Pseudomonas sp. PCH446]